MIEEWRDVLNFEGYYQVSNLGRVKSMPRELVTPRGGRYTLPERMRKICKKDSGYAAVGLCIGRKITMHFIHTLVLEAFVSPRPEGMEGCHSDNDRMNARLDNLRWDTSKNNKADCILHGTSPQGERHGNAKLSDATVLEARKCLADGESPASVAHRLAVSVSLIYLVRNGKSWKHVA